MTAVAGIENIERSAARRREWNMTVKSATGHAERRPARPARRLLYTDCCASSTTPLR